MKQKQYLRNAFSIAGNQLIVLTNRVIVIGTLGIMAPVLIALGTLAALHAEFRVGATHAGSRKQALSVNQGSAIYRQPLTYCGQNFSRYSV